MKYIKILGLIMAVAVILSAGLLLSRKTVAKNAYLVINDRTITKEEFEKMLTAGGYHLRNREEFLDALVTKELLIHEAKRLGLDRDEAFRQSLQNFYEQSLIKALMGRKFGAGQQAVSDEEVSLYNSLVGSTVEMTSFRAPSPETLKDTSRLQGESRTLPFDSLAPNIRCALARLKTGEVTPPFRSGDGYSAIRLDRVLPPAAPKTGTIDAEKVRKLLAEDKREAAMSAWMDELKRTCIVRIEEPDAKARGAQ
jgi:hypothetical protein